MLQATPGQLVFGRDLILNIKHVADWNAILERKQKLIDQNNRRENSKRIQHKYRVGDEVLMYDKAKRKYETPHDGPYRTTEVFRNRNVRIQKGVIEDRVNIRNIIPYKE